MLNSQIMISALKSVRLYFKLQLNVFDTGNKTIKVGLQFLIIVVTED